jgi:cold shock CspA family protein
MAGKAAGPAGNGTRTANAATSALKKFAVAEEVRINAEARRMANEVKERRHDRGTTAAAVPQVDYAGATGEDQSSIFDPAAAYEIRRRVAAEARAEATAARISATVGNGNDIATAPVGLDAGPIRMGGNRDEPNEARHLGKIKVYNAGSGFGFIQSGVVQNLYGCDAFFNQAVEGGIIVGGIVSFVVELNKDGKPQARKIRLEQEGSGGADMRTIRAPPYSVAGPTAFTSQMPSQLLHGRVKSFNEARGFGFVVCRDTEYQLYGRDIFVSKAQVPDGVLVVGQEVAFRLNFDQQGQPQARDLQVVAKRPMRHWP